MYVYVRANGESFYTVGFYGPSGRWIPESDQDTKEEAADRVHWLNGGNPAPKPVPATMKAETPEQLPDLPGV